MFRQALQTSHGNAISPESFLMVLGKHGLIVLWASSLHAMAPTDLDQEEREGVTQDIEFLEECWNCLRPEFQKAFKDKEEEVGGDGTRKSKIKTNQSLSEITRHAENNEMNEQVQLLDKALQELRAARVDAPTGSSLNNINIITQAWKLFRRIVLGYSISDQRQELIKREHKALENIANVKNFG